MSLLAFCESTKVSHRIRGQSMTPRAHKGRWPHWDPPKMNAVLIKFFLCLSSWLLFITESQATSPPWCHLLVAIIQSLHLYLQRKDKWRNYSRANSRYIPSVVVCIITVTIFVLDHANHTRKKMKRSWVQRASFHAQKTEALFVLSIWSISWCMQIQTF